MKRSSIAMLLSLSVGACARTPPAKAQPAPDPAAETLAPELEGGLAWLNTDKPLKLQDLRGQVVILDFWTYCCINCMQVLPVLHELEVTHAKDPVVVIGVHSAKFAGERDPERIREAVLRYGVTHPVYVDDNNHVWERYDISSWPTLVIIRPNGRIAAVAPGEPDPAVLGDFVNKVLADARADGSLAKSPAVIHRPAEQDTGALSFPGKVLAAADGRIFVSDSGHHRVLVLDRTGHVLDTIGSGLRGVQAGAFSDASFDDPEGLALDGDSLYIADARGHDIIRADLKARTVTRIAGTGQLGAAPLDEPAPGLETALRAPWALALDGSRLLFAVAGSHQIGVLDLHDGTVRRFAGTGHETIVDGAAEKASFAQPSGLSIHANTLFVADSEDSGVRGVNLKTGATKTLVGTGLFDFGDVDGPVDVAKLQHPLDVAWTSAGLAVADTYNNKLKVFLPDLTGIGAVDIKVGGQPLYEPGGLTAAPDGSVIVADTNHHRLVRVPVVGGRLDGSGATEIVVQGAPRPAAGVTLAADATVHPAAPSTTPGTPVVELPALAIGSGSRKVSLTLTAPQDFEITDGAPFDVTVRVESGKAVSVSKDRFRGQESGAQLRVDVPVEVNSQAGDTGAVVADVRAVICAVKAHAACYPIETVFKLPVTLSSAGADAEYAAVFPRPKAADR